MANTEREKLFAEFPAVSTEQWEAVITTDLKGADYERKLVWKTAEGFNVRPYYRAENLEGIALLTADDPFGLLAEGSLLAGGLADTPAACNQTAVAFQMAQIGLGLALQNFQTGHFQADALEALGLEAFLEYICGHIADVADNGLDLEYIFCQLGGLYGIHGQRKICRGDQDP